MTLRSVVVSGLCAGLLSVGAQEAPPTFRVSVDMVQLDAVVTGAKGQHIADLKPEEFEVQVDGVPQKLLACRYIRFARPSAARSETARLEAPSPRSPEMAPAEVGRTIVFLVDDGSLKYDAIYPVRKALKTIIDREVQPGDMVALVRTMSGEGALEQFTADKSLLYSAVDRIRWLSIGRSLVPAKTNCLDRDNSAIYLRSSSISKAVDTYMKVLGRLRGMPGKKAVMFISQDWPIRSMAASPGCALGDTVTATHAQEIVDAAVRSGATIYSIDPTPLDTLNPGADFDLQKTSIAKYGLKALDPPRPMKTSAPSGGNASSPGGAKGSSGGGGNQSSDGSSEEGGIKPSNVQDLVQGYRQNAFFLLELSRTGMRIMAEKTGGLMYADTNDISWGISKFFSDQQGYYQLEFRPDSRQRFLGSKAGETPFHNVRIRVKRQGLKVRYHGGFYGRNELAPEAPAGLAGIDKAISSPFPEPAIRVRLAASFNQPDAGAPQIGMTLNIKAQDIAFTPSDGRENADLELVARTVDEKGQPVESVKKTIALRLAEGRYEEAKEKGLTYRAAIPAARPGFYDVRIVVRDAKTDKLGSARQVVEVPDLKKGRLTMAGLAAFDPSSDADAGEFGVPSQGVFARDDTVRYSCRIFNAKAGQIEAVARVLREGKPVLVLTAPELAKLPQDGLEAAGPVPLESLEPGEYVLEVAVYEPATKSLASQSTEFAVLP